MGGELGARQGSFVSPSSEPASPPDVDDDELATAPGLRHEATQVVSPEEPEAGLSAAQVTLTSVCLLYCLNRPSSQGATWGFFRPLLALLAKPLFLWDKRGGVRRQSLSSRFSSLYHGNK